MSRKGVVSQVFYFPFLLICTFVIVIVFAFAPANTLDETIKVASLDANIMRQSFENKVNYKDPFTLRDYSLTLENKDFFKNNFKDYFSLINKDSAYKLTFEGKESYYDKDLFLMAKNIVPVGDHLLITFRKKINCLQGSCGKVKFEQLLPKVYHVK